MKEKFKQSLENNDLTLLRQIPKSDLHNHSTRGGNKRYIEEWAGINIPEPPKFNSLDDMQKWYDQYIKPYCHGKIGFTKRIEAAFQHALDDGITVLHMSFGIGDKFNFNGSINDYIEAIKDIHLRVAPQINFIPEICFGRTNDIYNIEKEFDEILSYNFFKSIDLMGDDTKPVDNFKNVYRKAKANKMLLKAHVGEFGDSSTILKVVDILELDQIQHGINAVYSNEVMRELRDRNIQLNICPTSNIMLNRVNSYKVHPIRNLFDAGVNVTINTDDMLIFNKSVSEEFLCLYEAGLFNVDELNSIREQGLKNYNK